MEFTHEDAVVVYSTGYVDAIDEVRALLAEIVEELDESHPVIKLFREAYANLAEQLEVERENLVMAAASDYIDEVGLASSIEEVFDFLVVV